MSLIIEDLTHIYRSPSAEQRQVLDIPAWTIEASEQVLVRGVSGSGKTTLFNIIAGLLHPTTGTITLNKTSLYSLSEAQRDSFRAQHIGYIYQSHYLLNTLSAIENVIMPMAFARQQPPNQWRKRARELLEQIRLGDHLDYHPAQLSTGQRMRVAVARALVNRPRVLLADEPTASLDSDTSEIVMNLIQQTCSENNAILLVASHDPALNSRFSKIMHLRVGHVQAQEVSKA